jgi:hypothetical protein
MGIGLGLALGAKAAHPERPLLCFMGDGAVGFTITGASRKVSAATLGLAATARSRQKRAQLQPQLCADHHMTFLS